MTIGHAKQWLWDLGIESRNMRRTYTPRQAKKLARAARRYADEADLGSPNYTGVYQDSEQYEWWRLLVRCYDESIRLREIAEGKR